MNEPNPIEAYQSGQAVAFSAFLTGLGLGLVFATKYGLAVLLIGILLLAGTTSKFRQLVLGGGVGGSD